MRRFLANKYFAALLVVVAVAAEFGLAKVKPTPPRWPGLRRLWPPGPPCPPRSWPARHRARRVATASGLAVAAASTGSGKAEVSRLSPAGTAVAPTPLNALAHPGQLALVNVPVVHPLARGAHRRVRCGQCLGDHPRPGRRDGPGQRGAGPGPCGRADGAGGLATAPCPGPGTDFWFVGPGAAVRDIELYLMNTDGQPADAWTRCSPTAARRSAARHRDLVPPHSMVIQSLGKLLHGSRVIALHVTTSAGQVWRRSGRAGAGPTRRLAAPPQPPSTTRSIPACPARPAP